MNVAPDLLVQLARAAGAPMDSRAEAVVRWATQKLKEREPVNEWWVEVLSGETWDFHSFHKTHAEAFECASKLSRSYARKYRIVEIVRRIGKVFP